MAAKLMIDNAPAAIPHFLRIIKIIMTITAIEFNNKIANNKPIEVKKTTINQLLDIGKPPKQKPWETAYHEGRKAVIYAIGGFGATDANLSDVEFWNEKQQRWEVYPFWQLYQPRVSMASVVANDGVYTLGGIYLDPVNFVECYQHQRGNELRQPMPQPRYNFAAVTMNDTIFVIGGASIGVSFSNLISKIEKYVIADDLWLSTIYTEDNNPLQTPRDGLAAVTHNTSIYIFGGRDSQGQPLNIVEKLDLGDELTLLEPKNETSPNNYELFPNYPNPFNSTTVISFSLKETAQHIQLRIYNINGQTVTNFQWSELAPGLHRVTWDGSDWSGNSVKSGIYFYQLILGATEKEVKKLMYIR